MTTAAYQRWVAAGKPLEPSEPVREFVGQMAAVFPRAQAVPAARFSWYTNDAHLLADPPEDHTPFSATDWPVSLDSPPFWLVMATDIMHRPDLGVDCDALFLYWITEARSGRMPFLKYLNWRGMRYDVRNGWRPVPTTGHFDHIHLSFRTDWRDRGLEGWTVVPMEGNPMATLSDADLAMMVEAARIITTGKRGPGKADTADGGVPIADEQRQFYDIDQALIAVARTLATVATDVAALKTGGGTTGGLSADDVRTIVRTELDGTKLGRAAADQPS